MKFRLRIIDVFDPPMEINFFGRRVDISLAAALTELLLEFHSESGSAPFGRTSQLRLPFRSGLFYFEVFVRR